MKKKTKTKIYSVTTDKAVCEVYINSVISARFFYYVHSDGFEIHRIEPRERYPFMQYLNDICSFVNIIRKMF